MAISKIPASTGGGAEAFTGTRDTSNIPGGACRGIYDKTSNVVTITFHCATSSGTIPGGGATLFTIPEKYRPSEDKTASCMGASNTVVTVGNCKMSSNGELSHSASSTFTKLYGVIQYILD